MTHAYQAALQKITADPLSLTPDDFAVLQEFNPRDEVRARDAVRTKQLEIVQTKAIAAPHEPSPTVANAVHEIVKVLHHIKGRLETLERETSEIAGLRKSVRDMHAIVQTLEHRPDPADAEIDPAMFDTAH